MSKITFSKTFQKQFKKIPKQHKEVIKQKIRIFQLAPELSDTKPLKPKEHGYHRLRIGQYRLIYVPNQDSIAFLEIGTRGDIYK